MGVSFGLMRILSPLSVNLLNVVTAAGTSPATSVSSSFNTAADLFRAPVAAICSRPSLKPFWNGMPYGPADTPVKLFIRPTFTVSALAGAPEALADFAEDLDDELPHAASAPPRTKAAVV